MKIAITCKKCDIDCVVISLECEGYKISEQHIPLQLDNITETTLHAVCGEKSNTDESAWTEFCALSSAGWFTPPCIITSCFITDDKMTHITWPT